MLTEATLREALRDCYDPEIPLNILDLGLLESLALTPDLGAPGSGISGVPPRFLVEITLIPTTADEAANAQLSAQIANRLAAFEQVSRTIVQLRTTPAWTPQRISPEGRRQLGLDRAPSPFAILNNRIN